MRAVKGSGQAREDSELLITRTLSKDCVKIMGEKNVTVVCLALKSCLLLLEKW